MQGEGTAGIRG